VNELFLRLARAPARDLERLVRSSAAPALDAVVGFEWAGFNTPATSTLLGIRKFIKVFERGPEGVEGYNMRAAGTRLDEPWVRRVRVRAQSKIGFYAVTAPGAHDGPYPQAALIDYGARPDQMWIARAIDDYLVQPDSSEPDVLLGKAYFTFATLHVPAGYFVLERLRPIANE
jgi:hypothetical protein